MFKSRAITFILITLMIDAIGIGIVFPIMPDLMDRVGAGDTGQGAFWGGLLMAAYAGALFLCGPIVGSISDAVGRRPILIAALIMLALDYVIMALADNFWLLLFGRTLAGLAGATYITATAYIADISSPTEKAANFGLIGAAFGIGFVLGPAIGGIAAEISITAPFWIAAVLSAANAMFGVYALPESLTPEKRRPFGKRDLNPLKSIFDAFRFPGLAVPLLCIFIFEFANMVYPTLWAYWIREVFGWSTLYIGLSLAAYGVLLAFVQAGLMPIFIRWIGDYRTLLLGMASALIGMIGFGFTATVTALVIFILLAALSDLVPALITAMASNQADEDRQGLVQGVIASLSSVAAVLSPLVMTVIFQASVDGEGTYLPGAPFFFSAAMVLVMMPFVFRLRGHASS
ncbi:MFS transporter, DHA1 family, tetracycline resistance protein [Ruegeria halocynthiae]|uniref:MFS transporter, DHA1 family, tetracycline resistance protein n=1 Tax=Ruegeria halocynthiae TaxID=985054 RepID=A0A1H3A377_9RHOB|nr:MFS transporter [Ruegeria halocynthiae]SDX23379.1 MFS transporter, DHA1 family, tetracycline resistance protein [Ruegeria halocynthiae]